MTERLYYTESHLRMFTAEVVEGKQMDREEGGSCPAVRLNRTAFYPTSGGQPHDTGTLDGVPVLDVVEGDAGEIWHVLDRELSDETEDVVGRIDWARRFDHMQQHSGQHLLSAVFGAQMEARTVGFRLGTGESTIDLDVPDLTWESAVRIENAVNQVVWADGKVEIRMVTEDVLDEIDLRKPPSVTGTIRVVLMGDADASACGGTHVTRTGEIGLIKITDLSNYKGGTRLAFLCGGRALAHYQQVLQLMQTSSLQLSVASSELPEAIKRLQGELKVTHRTLQNLEEEWAELKAEQLWSDADRVGDARVVTHVWTDRDFDDVRAVAFRLRERPRTVALLAATGQGVRLVCASSEGLPEINAVEVLQRALEPLDGRGGGSPSVAQGGAPPQSAADVMAALRESLDFEGAWRSESTV